MSHIRPPALYRGDTVGVIAPAGPVDTTRIEERVRRLEQWGLSVVLADNLDKRIGYLAGRDNARIAATNELFTNPDIDALICARGGYGCQRIVDRLAWEALTDRPRILMGASDCTVLLLAAYTHCRLPTFHGPMFLTTLGLGDPAEFFRSQGRMLLSHDSNVDSSSATKQLFANSVSELEEVRGGAARGPLIGGCLSLLSTLVGTPYMEHLDDAIIFIEDVHEAPYRIDRMLQHLRLSGVLDNISALLFGTFRDCDANGARPGVIDVIREQFSDARYPVVAGLPFGHGAPRTVLPVGIPAELTTSPFSLRLLRWPVYDCSSSS